MSRLSTSELRRVWAPPCVGPWAQVTLFGGARVTVDPLIVPAVLALSGVFERHAYRATPPDTGAYNCRRITGGSGYSLHAYGIAVDVNWLDNPYGKRLITDMPRAMVDEIKALRTVSGHQVWAWGGDFRSNKDAMHFEIVCTPEQLATGIRSTSTPTVPPAGRPDPKEWDEMATKDEVKLALAELLAERGVATKAEVEEIATVVISAVTGSQISKLRDKATNLGDVVNLVMGLRSGGGNVDVAALAGQLRDALGDAVADELARRLAA